MLFLQSLQGQVSGFQNLIKLLNSFSFDLFIMAFLKFLVTKLEYKLLFIWNTLVKY